MTNARAKTMLEGVGIRCECEPDWIEEGQKPDFFCSGRYDFWCEVKTLGPPGDFEMLGDAHVELRQRASEISLPGQGFAWVRDNLDHRDAKVLISLLERSLRRFQDENAPEKVVVVIPDDTIYSEFVRFSISTKDRANVEISGCVSRTGKYGHPPEIFPHPYTQMTRLRFSSGKEQEVLAPKVLELRDKFRAAVVVEPDERPFHFLATAPSGGAKKSRNSDRIREAVAEANGQFKNAVKYKEAPCLLTLFHDAVDVPEEEIIKSALYGDLKYTFSPDRFESGNLIFQGNGAWNGSKNRTTSAVMYIRNNGQPLIVHNYWADRPFPQSVVECREIVALEDGTFREIDNSPNRL